MIDPNIRFLAVVGPTATGKTELGLALAERFGGEIVCADSRTLYRGMDIGTAKPTKAEQSRVAHHLLDILNPGESLSAVEFKQLAETAIGDIAARGSLPIMVGGSGLYADAVLFDYQFLAKADPKLRARLSEMSKGELLEQLAADDPKAYGSIDQDNRRRVIRAIETAGEQPSKRKEMLPQALVFGRVLNKELVQEMLKDRIEKMLSRGFIAEIEQIIKTYGPETPALQVMGYRAFKGYVLGDKTLEKATVDCLQEHMSLYKKQVTWFKRHQDIRWVEGADQAVVLAEQFVGNGSSRSGLRYT